MTQTRMFHTARWVQASAPCVSPEFRAVFSAKQDEHAVITISGLGFFELYLNGVRVSHDLFVPVNSHYHPYPDCACEKEFGERMESRIYAVQYDLSAYLREGENELTAVVGPGWYFRYGDCKLCFRIAFDDREVVSGDDLLWRPGPVVRYALTRGEAHDYTTRHSWQRVQVTDVPATRYDLQDCPPDRVVRSLEPRRIDETQDAYLYDLGENLTGWPIVRCAEPGATITVKAAEIYDPETHSLPEKWAHAQVCTFVCDGTERDYHPRFTWCAGRYYSVSKNAQFVRFDEIHADVPCTAAFQSSSETLDWFFDAFVRTQLSNMHAGIPSDCPHLERRGYTGDGELVCEAGMMLFKSRAFYRKWMRDISDCQDRVSGHVQYTAPYVQSGGGPGGWGCAIVEVPYTYYKVFGDAEPFAAYLPQMLRYFDYLQQHSENDLVTSDQPGQWCLGEWCVPGQKQLDGIPLPNPLVNTYFFIKSIDRILEMAPRIGRQALLPELRALRERKVQAVLDAYYDAQTGDFAHNGNCANAFAIDLGLGDARTLQNLARHVQALDVMDTGIFGTDIVPRILFEHGYADLAFRFLTHEKKPSFGYMRACGATTLWEEWLDPRSMSHPMFGAPVRYLFQYVLGIRQTADSCGYAKVMIDPARIEALPKASGHMETVHGTIRVALDREAGTAAVEVPQGIEAVFRRNGKEIPLRTGRNELTL